MNHIPKILYRTAVLFLVLLFLPILPGVSRAEGGKVLTLPKNLRTIGVEAYCGDTSIEKVVLQEHDDGKTTRIESRAFAGSSLREIHLSASVSYIAEDAFDNTCLETVTAPKGSYAYQWAREHRYITEYRALLIGETKFLRHDEDGNAYISVANRNVNDVNNMITMLGKVCGPTGEKFQVTKKVNIGRDRIQSTIQSAFAGTMDHDVSLFFIATHGKTEGDGDLEMPFRFVHEQGYEFVDEVPGFYDYQDAYLRKQYLDFSTLAGWLSGMVNGKVIVILESCSAGSAIYAESNGAKRDTKTEEELSEDFVQEAVKAFAKADPGIITAPEPDAFRKTTGDLRQPKFYVLAAAKHGEDSWGYGNDQPNPVNLFTMWLIEGVGVKGNSPADKNPKDNILILDELYNYITGVQRKQHVQVYPENSNQAIFLLK